MSPLTTAARKYWLPVVAVLALILAAAAFTNTVIGSYTRATEHRETLHQSWAENNARDFTAVYLATLNLPEPQRVAALQPLTDTPDTARRIAGQDPRWLTTPGVTVHDVTTNQDGTRVAVLLIPGPGTPQGDPWGDVTVTTTGATGDAYPRVTGLRFPSPAGQVA